LGPVIARVHVLQGVAFTFIVSPMQTGLLATMFVEGVVTDTTLLKPLAGELGQYATALY